MINHHAIIEAFKEFKKNKPFPFCVVDNFFDKDIAHKLEKEFPAYDSETWHVYNNPLEIKKTCNNWNDFLPLTYKVFSYLNTPEFTDFISKISGISPLFSDPGLHGGGWHIHPSGGKLNTHLDYSIHPKYGLQRKANLIIYLNANWQEEWGGEIGLWEHDASTGKAGALAHKIPPLFNRAIFFDTTQNSWHGLPDPIQCPQDEFRKSLAVYYLVKPASDAASRERALFLPSEKDMDNPEVLDLIQKRSSVEKSKDVYIANKLNIIS